MPKPKMPEILGRGFISDDYYQLSGKEGAFTVEHDVGDIHHYAVEFSLPNTITRKEAETIVKKMNQIMLKWYELGVRRGFGDGAAVLENFHSNIPLRNT